MLRHFLLATCFCCLPATAFCQTDDDKEAIKLTLDSWNRGWANRDANLAIRDDVDCTNTFGDRFQGRAALKKGLESIFGLDFVMAGDSGQNEFEDVTFSTPDIALLRSKLVRVGQETSGGELMPDRHIHHLRVMQRQDGRWKIVSHLISQSHPKGSDRAENDR